MSDAPARVPGRLVGDRVAELLLEAGAPKGPWEGDVQLLSKAAELINSAGELSDLGKSLKEYFTILHRAQKAIQELRVTLPLILQAESDMMRSRALLSMSDFTKKNEKRRAAVSKLLHALCDLAPPHSAEKSFTHWHTTATVAFHAYRQTVGSGSKSKNGRAVRFISLVLLEVGHGIHMPEAIEAALNRSHNSNFEGKESLPIFE